MERRSKLLRTVDINLLDMEFETLPTMDAEADRIIANSIVDPSVGIEAYTKNLGDQLSGVYGAALSPDLLAQYGIEAGKWAIEHPAETCIIVQKVGGAFKRVYHDLAAGKKAPIKEEFRHSLDFSRAENSMYAALL
jgi:hypothetical protein